MAEAVSLAVETRAGSPVSEGAGSVGFIEVSAAIGINWLLGMRLDGTDREREIKHDVASSSRPDPTHITAGSSNH